MNYPYSFRKMIRKLKMAPLKNLLLRELAEFADEYGGSIFPSITLLQEHTGISRPWVIKLLKELCEEGYLLKLENSFYKSNLYQLALKFIEEQYILQTDSVSKKVNNQDDLLVNSVNQTVNSEVVNPVNQLVNSVNLTSKLSLPNLPYNYHITNNTYVQKVNFSEKTEPIQKPETPSLEEKTIQPDKPVEAKKTSQQGLPFSEKETEKKTKTKPSKVNMEEQFEQWYTAYPKHEARKKGYEAFLKAWPKIDFERLLELTQAYARSVEGKDKQFLPLPASWLNGERWKDDSIAGYCLAKTTTQSQIPTPTQTQPVSDSYEPPINLDSSAAQLAVADKNLGSFVKTFPHIDSASIFAEAQMLKFGDKITIYHKYAFCLNQMKIEEDRLMKFFNVSIVEFTNQPLEEPSIKLVYPPKPETEKAPVPENKPEPYTPPATEIKPPRYRTLNESYQGSTSQSLGASLAALQRSYQQKLQTTG